MFSVFVCAGFVVGVFCFRVCWFCCWCFLFLSVLVLLLVLSVFVCVGFVVGVFCFCVCWFCFSLVFSF